MKKKQYVEPSDFFPKEIRKKFKLGEYNDEVNEADTKAKKEQRDKENKEFRDYVNKRD